MREQIDCNFVSRGNPEGLRLINFGSLAGSQQDDVSYDLKKFFDALDVKGTHTEPRKAQGEAMQALTERQAERDVVLKVSTGAGKTTVGLLYLYGFMRVSRRPVVYLCPTVQLVEQVLEEAQRLGMSAHAYPGGERYPTQECVRGEAILVCTYEKLFNAKSTFARQDVNLIPYAVVLDDAHAGVENIRKQFTLLIEGEPFKKLLSVLGPACKSYHATKWADISSEDPSAILEVPHWLWTDFHDEIQLLLHQYATEKGFEFVWPYLKDRLRLCRCAISGTRAEIAPEVLPTDQIRAFTLAEHRLFMSATLADDSLLTRELGVAAQATATPILPPSDRGLGERMILAPSLVDPELDREYVINLCADLSKRHNVVVLTSSGQLAADWVAKGATYYADENFSVGVQKLKTASSGERFAVFAQRFDGVDLPDDACRVLVIDGMPYGGGLIDKLDSEMFSTPGGARNRTVFRIEQGMGRPVRSHADFAVVLLAGQDLTTYVGRRDVLAAMTHDSRNQLNLCYELAELVRAEKGTPDTAIRQVIDQCLLRDPGWKHYYNQKIREVARQSQPINAIRISLAERERNAHVMAQNNSLLDAKNEFERAINEAGLVGEELGGFLQRLSRIAYLSDPAEAMRLQQGARTKSLMVAIPPAMPRNPPVPGGKTVAEKMCAWIRAFASLNAAVIAAKRIADSLDLSQPPKKVEAALHSLGEAIGADASRPDEEYRDGPDNIWIWGNHCFVLEAKSGNTQSLHKKDSGQLHDSLQWARNSYPQFSDRLQPVIVARVTKVDGDANFLPNTRILTQAGCTAMGSALHQLMQKLAELGPVFVTPDSVLLQIQNFGLNPDNFIGRHTVPLS
ncbi:hypothetical protein ALISP_2539 [Alicycliphilus sp. B1]|nr:hypothetical protein ALISP_2539 [Alicycliphilus sp. B1]